MGSYAVNWNNVNVRGLYLNSVDVDDFNLVELVNGEYLLMFLLYQVSLQIRKMIK
jgi:hypothetical protein